MRRIYCRKILSVIIRYLMQIFLKELAEAKLGEDKEVHYQIHILWGHLCEVLPVSSLEPRFNRLAQVAETVQIVPQSSASEKECSVWFTKHNTVLCKP